MNAGFEDAVALDQWLSSQNPSNRPLKSFLAYRAVATLYSFVLKK